MLRENYCEPVQYMCHTLGTQCHTLRPHNVTHFAHTMYHTVSHTLDTQQTLPVEKPGQAEDKGTGSSPLLPGCRCADGILVAEDRCKILCPALPPPRKGSQEGLCPFCKIWRMERSGRCILLQPCRRDKETGLRDSLPGRPAQPSGDDTQPDFVTAFRRHKQKLPANMTTIRLTKI